MNGVAADFRPVSRFLWRVLSVPLFFKIMGIGVLVAAIFGGATLLQIGGSISRTLYQVLEEKTRSTARSLVASLERPMSTGDVFTVNQKIRRTVQTFPDVRYIIVQDARGTVVAHTFERGVPAALVRPSGDPVPSQEQFQVFDVRDGLIFDVTSPILKGHAGTLQLGISDQMITRELSSVTRSVLWSLGLCVLIGAGLALLLTYILTQPIRNLVQVANRIRRGDFQARADVFSADEIGRLAAAFNQMTESLQRYRREVEEKERVRLFLIEKIVHAQEEERKVISRELHDQLGQSLLALLLAVQAVCKENTVPEAACLDIEERIRHLIDEVRQLAWGMRPSILDDYGLDSALARYVEEMSEHSDLQIDYQYSGPSDTGRLPANIEVTLYRISQEAITNVVHHAHATRASAVVLQHCDEVTLLVEDNGRGFDTNSVLRKSESSLGLTGMTERVALLGGKCVVESAPNQGTTIRITIPLKEHGE